jgi:fucose 4-O-acetylase-like acetyltransferase
MSKVDLFNKQNRIGYIDIAKGLGMLTIIWGHICYVSISKSIVYAFHIPLFFFLSGFVFQKQRYNSFGVFLKKRAKGLLFPYVVFSFVTWIVWVLYSCLTHSSVESYWMPLLQTFISQGSEGYLVHNVPLWFVMCLFAVEVLYYFIAKLSDLFNIIICIILAIVGVWTTRVTFFDFSSLPWSIDVAFMAIPFYTMGNLLAVHYGHGKISDIVNDNKLVCFLLLLATAFILYQGASYNGSASMGHADLGKNPFVFYGTAVCGIVCFMIMCIFLGNLKDNKLLMSVKWFGQNSFRVMAIHNPIKGVVIVVLAKFIHTTASKISSNIEYSVIAFLITLIATIIIVILIERGLNKVLKRNSLLK